MVWRRLFCVPALSLVVTSIGAQVSRPVAVRVSDVHPRAFQRAAESPNGRFIVVSGDSGIYRYDRTKKNWARLTDEAMGPPAWSPDGRFLAVARRDAASRKPYIWIVPIDSSTGLASGPDRRVTVRDGVRPVWSRDGRELAFVSMDSGQMHLWVAPFNGGDERLVAKFAGGVGDAPAWSADGKSIYFTYAPPKAAGRLARVSLATGKIDSVAPGNFLIGVSKDGKYLAQALPGGTVITIVSADDGRELERIVLPPHVQISGWSMNEPNQLVGRELLIRSEIHSVSLTTGAVRALTHGDSIDHTNPVISRDGKLLAYASKGTRGYEIVVSPVDGSGTAKTIATPTGIDANSLAWSPSASRLAYRSVEPSELHVIDVTTGADRKLAAVHESWINGTAGRYIWRKDGQALRYLQRDSRGGRFVRTVNEVTLDGRDAVIATPPDTLVADMRFIADSLLVMSTSESLEMMSLPSGGSKKVYGPRGSSQARVGLSADGKSIIFEDRQDGDNGATRLVSLIDGASRLVANPLGGEVAQFYFMPDGRHAIIAVCARCVDVERWSMVLLPLNGDPPRVLSAQDHGMMDWNVLALAKDGKTAFYDAELAWRSTIVHIPVSVITRASKPK